MSARLTQAKLNEVVPGTNHCRATTTTTTSEMTTTMEETKRSTTTAANNNNGAANLFSSSDDNSKNNKRSPSAAAPSAAPKKVVIKSADMKDDMQNQAIDCALYAFDKYSVEKEIAEHIKKEFDKKHGPTWHCIVGRNFGSYVTHETNHFVYFYLDQKAILLFKSG